MCIERLCVCFCIGIWVVALVDRPLCKQAAAQATPKRQSGEGDGEKSAEIKRLLKERHALLEKCVTILTAQYNIGAVEFPRLAQAELDAVRAALDATDDGEKRIAVLERYKKAAESIVQVAEARSKVGAVGEVDVHQANALLLQVRIEILREEQKAKLRK
jgi:hypothetical protein